MTIITMPLNPEPFSRALAFLSRSRHTPDSLQMPKTNLHGCTQASMDRTTFLDLQYLRDIVDES